MKMKGIKMKKLALAMSMTIATVILSACSNMAGSSNGGSNVEVYGEIKGGVEHTTIVK